MRAWGLVMMAALLVVPLGGCQVGDTSSGAGSSTLPWQKTLAPAVEQACREHKLVLVSFYTDWCGWCKKLEGTTFADLGVQRALDRVVLVKLNAETDGRRDADRFGVDSYPTIVFLDGGGKEVARIPGYLEPGPFLAELEDILRKA